MRIGIDIDGVLNYRQAFVIECGTKFCVETGKGKLTNVGALVDGMPRATWEETTKLWLDENGILYDGIAFDLGRPAPDDKGTFCAEHGVEVMIDDLPEYLLGMAGKTQVMIFDQPYNRDLVIEGAKRVYSWYDIYDKIKSLSGGIR